LALNVIRLKIPALIEIKSYALSGKSGGGDIEIVFHISNFLLLLIWKEAVLSISLAFDFPKISSL
jgi:hypothetical protein